MHELLIKNGNPYGYDDNTDIAINNGIITAIKKDITEDAKIVINAAQRFIGPSFIDSHTHLDKSMSAMDMDAAGLSEAIAQSIAFQKSVPLHKVRENVKVRGRQMLNWEAANGSCTIKTHVLVDDRWGMEALYATNDLKEEYKGKLDIINITPYHPDYDDEWKSAAKNGDIDFIAGYPGLLVSDTFAEDTNLLFDLAVAYDLPLDLHVNESDAPDLRTFEYILKKTQETGLGNRVTLSHLTALNAVSDSQASEDISLAAELGINIVTLPSCNMYLMGRDDKEPIRRGLTRVREFLKAGVNIAFASDNIRDHFRPFGNGDMLEEALFTAQCLQFGTRDQLKQIFEMGTFNPAKNCRLDNYGLKAGCRADLNIFRESSVSHTIISQHPRLYVIKDGHIIAKNGELIS